MTGTNELAMLMCLK